MQFLDILGFKITQLLPVKYHSIWTQTERCKTKCSRWAMLLYGEKLILTCLTIQYWSMQHVLLWASLTTSKPVNGTGM